MRKKMEKTIKKTKERGKKDRKKMETVRKIEN